MDVVLLNGDGMKSYRYKIDQIKLELGESKDLLPQKIAKKLRKNSIKIWNLQILKESIDARKKSDIKLVYSVSFFTDKKLDLPLAEEFVYAPELSGKKELTKRPVVVGFGPCGMFCALVLAEYGYRPIVLERGYDVDTRVKSVNKFWGQGTLDTECNVQFGEGGAGTFSDGKLTTGIKDPRKFKVFDEFVAAGADPDIKYVQKPHIGTDVLRTVVKNIRNKIIELGGEVIFGARLDRILENDGRVFGVSVLQGNSSVEMETDTLVLAMGHSARDTLRQLFEDGIKMEQKPFSIGVRIEHPQKMIDESQYGLLKDTEILPPASYKISHRCKNGRGVYTFCMCPGGEVIIASSQKNRVVTNGMSYRKRNSGIANSGLLVDVRISDFGSDNVLAGVEFQEKYEALAYKNGSGNYKAPTATWKDFRDGTKEAFPVIESMPGFAVDAIREAMPHLGRKLKGFDRDDAKMTAVETRSSSPVRILRDSNFESNLKGLFPGGEGAGYAGGITSSACDGIKIAEELMKRYRPIKTK